MAEVVQAGRFSIPVLYEDNHLLVVVKPPNLPSQADSSGDEDLLGILKGYIGKKYQKPGNVYLGLGASPGPSRGRGDGLRPHLEGGGAAVESVCRPRAGQALSGRVCRASFARNAPWRTGF